MARSLRIQFPGAYYHVTATGRRGGIFEETEDRKLFLDALDQACGMTGWRVHAWALTRNAYHLFIETPEPNLVEGMLWMQNVICHSYNLRHRKKGRLFTDRYKSVIVEGSDPYYLQTTIDYIHTAPIREKMVRLKSGQKLSEYSWSSLARGYNKTPGKRPRWMHVSAGLETFQLTDTSSDRQRMIAFQDERFIADDPKTCGIPPRPEGADARESWLGNGWYWGAPDFGAKMKQLAETQTTNPKPPRRKSKAGDLTHKHDEPQAKKWLTEGLKAAGLKIADLNRLPGSDPHKVLLADLLWRKTVVSQQWLAQKLYMHSAANVSMQLKRLNHEKAASLVPAALVEFLKGVELPLE